MSIMKIGLVFAAIYGFVALLVNLYGSLRLFKKYVETGRVSDDNDEPARLVKGDRFVFFKRDAGMFNFMTGLLLDLLVVVLLIHFWPIAIPAGLIVGSAVFLRLKKIRKDNFINALKGKRDEDEEWA
jgi:hypothetical protein